MSGKIRAAAAAFAVAPMIALGSGMATAEPAPVPAPISAPVPVEQVQPAALMVTFPWNFLTCIPAFSTGIFGYFACVA
ncbi:hypothetical protein ACFU44_05125 [Nocardia rhizosphaerihabitans]|uniref:hypothetical protein n=1 Tax=Nocardia rhizosphaerihabitans TaxID=1691570 RepID=UPI00366E75DB